ncbi:hypothetical protein ABXJ56_00980 [Microbacterium chocolatum]|uniref:hypothetical protein n=1 Tax=Microbacterium aurantiacum TaxID=162393 RepID=UPI00338F35DD
MRTERVGALRRRRRRPGTVTLHALAPDARREDQLRAARRITWIVSLVYVAISFVVFRDVLLGIPDVLAGRSVIVGDELVPFFNVDSQLLEQAAGQFNELTHGYEFRVRYAFLTTWVRHFQVLPFAILLVIPGIVIVAYRAVVWFLTDVFRTLSPVTIALSAALPVALVYAIMIYAKVTHFYTLALGLAMVTVSILLMLHALLFAQRRWMLRATLASVVVLLNPAVHYLVLFVVFVAVAGTTLLLGELARWIRTGGVRRLPGLPARIVAALRPRGGPRRIRLAVRRWSRTTIGRGVIVVAIFIVVTLIPYMLFVKFVALRGVENLSETVPGDYYFIRDASVSWLHVLSWDLAGIMDKILYGDYLAKVPRVSNLVYSVVFLVPFLVPQVRRALLTTRAHRQLFGVLAVVSAFAFWATIGYAEPQWFPSFHRTLSAVTRTLAGNDGPVGSISLSISSTIVQVLRFPHRFQLLLFVVAPLVMSLAIAWAVDAVVRRSMRRARAGDASLLRAAALVAIGAVFFAPLFSNANYRSVFGSGNFGTFLSPYPVHDLKELKAELLDLDEGKTVVLPPTETAKLVTDDNGIDHKFIDKFFIYYLDLPSYYYGLTGDSENKFEFFLLLRGLYYQQDWWINIARDIDLRYMIVNKKLRDNRGVGAEYLPDVETYIGPALQRQEAMGFVENRFENDTFILYELVDPPADDRPTLLVDTSWSEYLALLWNRLDLTRCYDLEYLPYAEETADALVYTGASSGTTAVDLWVQRHPEAFASPSPKIFPFNSDIVASSYYLSPMFRAFLMFSTTKWNRTEMITPGVFGTLRGSFIAVPRATGFTITATVDAPGRYRILLRGAATANALTVDSGTVDLDRALELRPAPGAVDFYTAETVYSSDRSPVDTDGIAVGEMQARLDDGLVAVNSRYEYHDLGTAEMDAGAHTLRIDKLDGNPLLVEGVVLVPETTYRGLTLAEPAGLVTSPAQLDCTDTYDVFGPDSEGYVDAAANDAHADLTEQELLDLAAAGVSSLEPEDSGGLGADGLVLLLASLLVLGAVLTIRARTRPRPDEATTPDDHGDLHD